MVSEKIAENLIITNFEEFKNFHKRQDEVNKKKIDVLDLEFWFVKEEFYKKYILDNRLFDGVREALNQLEFEQEIIDNLTTKELTAIFLFLYDELLTEKGKVYQLENEFLYSGTPDPDYLSAGAKRLAPFNNIATLDNLSGENVYFALKLAKEKYGNLLDFQIYRTFKNDVQERYFNIKNNKKK